MNKMHDVENHETKRLRKAGHRRASSSCALRRAAFLPFPSGMRKRAFATPRRLRNLGPDLIQREDGVSAKPSAGLIEIKQSQCFNRVAISDRKPRRQA